MTPRERAAKLVGHSGHILEVTQADGTFAMHGLVRARQAERIAETLRESIAAAIEAAVANEHARLLALAPRCTAFEGCVEPATWVSRCSLVRACDEHTDGDFTEAPHAALVRALRWPANAPLTTQKGTRG